MYGLQLCVVNVSCRCLHLTYCCARYTPLDFTASIGRMNFASAGPLGHSRVSSDRDSVRAHMLMVKFRLYHCLFCLSGSIECMEQILVHVFANSSLGILRQSSLYASEPLCCGRAYFLEATAPWCGLETTNGQLHPRYLELVQCKRHHSTLND